ncbi:MAG: hypothetical protein ABJB74_08500 [Gemmatimonas sp.]
MPDAAPAARGVYKPRRPHASPLFRLVSDHLHRLQTVYDERFAREYGPWRPVVGQVADKFLACGVRKHAPPGGVVRGVGETREGSGVHRNVTETVNLAFSRRARKTRVVTERRAV